MKTPPTNPVIADLEKRIKERRKATEAELDKALRLGRQVLAALQAFNKTPPQEQDNDPTIH